MKGLIKFTYIMIILLVYTGCVDSVNYEKLLEDDFNNIFFKNDKPFVTGEDIKLLNNINENDKYLEKLLELLKEKTAPESFSFGKNVKKDYYFNINTIYMTRKIKLSEKNNYEYYLKLYNELYKKLNVTAIISLKTGGYFYYYDYINQHINKYKDYDKDLIKDFISNLPSPKLNILCECMFSKIYDKNKKIDYKQVYQVYQKIDRNNYAKLLKNFKLFKRYGNELYKEFYKNIEAYYKLIELKEKI